MRQDLRSRCGSAARARIHARRGADAGLGIGATTAIFSVVHAVVLKPYAYVDPDRVLLAFSKWRGNRGSWSVGNFDYFRQRLTTVEEFAADTSTSFNLADNGEPERVFGGRVTHGTSSRCSASRRRTAARSR